MQKGYIPLPREVAAREISRVYSSAQHNIVASNVGGTAFYFSNPTYAKINSDTTDRGIPVIRFYLFSSSQRLQLHDSKDVRTYTIDEFFREVQELNDKLHTVYSAVIDVDKAGIQVQDLLIVDNSFIAETQFSPTDWQPERARATEYGPRLEDARTFFRDLRNSVDPKYVARMSDDDIKKRFHSYENTKLPKGNYVADQIFRDIMNEVAGP
jgi:O-phosphoseryl-tRNA(Cys) synthetase